MENFPPIEVLCWKSGNCRSWALKLKSLASSLFSVDLRYIENITATRKPAILDHSPKLNRSKLETSCHSL